MPPRKPAAADSVAAGPASQDSAAALLAQQQTREPARYPSLLELPETGGGAVVWDRARILESNAITLLDLLAEMVPGLTPVRAGFYGGPHHATLGAAGAPFLSLRVDGRDVLPLEGRQVDLARFPLGALERVRVVRKAAGLRVELATLSRSGPEAYSRIDAATGSPGVGIVRGSFTNGLGSNFAASASFDVVNTEALLQEDDRFDFRGRIAWNPGDRSMGLTGEIRSQSNTPTLLGGAERNLREFVVGIRKNMGPHVQAQAYFSDRRLSETVAAVDSVLTNLQRVGVDLTLVSERAYGHLRALLSGDSPFPSSQLSGRIGVRAVTGLTLDVTAKSDVWDGFSTSEVQGALALRSVLPLSAEIGIQAATGTRAVPHAAALAADTADFDALAGTLQGRIGPLFLSERVEYLNLSRQLPFGTVLDSSSVAAGPVEIVTFETAVEGPVLPVSWLIGGLPPIRLRGAYRFSSLRSGGPAIYVPRNRIAGEAFFQNEFFEGNLELRLGLGLNRRDAVFTFPTAAAPGAPVQTASATDVSFNLMVRLLEARIWWRAGNLRQAAIEDVPGIPYPTTQQAFGIKWEFTN
ncbi:MAG: TonB-dependent receptor plug domain-containing protein [Gemmatimonadota bacterium]